MEPRMKLIIVAVIFFNLFLGSIVYVSISMIDQTKLDQISTMLLSIASTHFQYNFNWRTSMAYMLYTKENRFEEDSGQQIERNPNYCREGEALMADFRPLVDQTGLPLKSFRTIFSDYPPESETKEFLQKYGSLSLEDHHIYTKNQVAPEELPYNITIFYHVSPDWHLFYEIGTQWLCSWQRYNHIPGHDAFCDPYYLVSNLREYHNSFIDREDCFDIQKTIPFTYVLADPEDCHSFFQTEMNQDITGKYYLKNRSEKEETLTDEHIEYLKEVFKYGAACGDVFEKFIIQKKIAEPLLIESEELELVSYMFIMNMSPMVVLYHDAYANTHQGTWSFEKLERYLSDKHLVKEGWLRRSLRPVLKTHMYHLVKASVDSLLAHPGVFELFAVHFKLDSNMHPWTLKVEKSPVVHDRSIVKDVLNIEYGYMFKTDLNKIIGDSEFEFIIDNRNPEDPYQGLISKQCTQSNN